MQLIALERSLDDLKQMLDGYSNTLGILPADWDNVAPLYYEAQAKALNSIRKAGSSVLQRGLLPDGGVLLVCGSIARLEYAPGVSDIDCLAVVERAKVNSATFAKKLRTAIRTHVGRAERELRSQFPSKVPERASTEIHVDVTGVPRRPDTSSTATAKTETEKKLQKKAEDAVYFYTKGDIFDDVGKPNEPAYAASERAHLLSQHALVGGSVNVHKRLQEKAEEMYWASSDLSLSEFPLVCYSFVTSSMWSGVTAKAAHVRSRPTEVDELVGKTVLGRIWSAKANVLALHMLYWEKEIGEVVTAERVLKVLQTPTVSKIVELFPEIVDKLDGRKLVKWERRREKATQGKVKKLTRRLDRVRRGLSIGREGRDTLFKSFLELLVHCIGVRMSPGGFSGDQVECIRRANRMFSKVLSEAREITKGFASVRISPSNLPSYARLGIVLPEELVP